MINLNNTFFFWIIVFLCVFLSGIVGYVAMILPKYGFFVIGAVFGVVCSLILNELIFESADPSNTLFRIVAILAGKSWSFNSRDRLWRAVIYFLEKNGDIDYIGHRRLPHCVEL